MKLKFIPSLALGLCALGLGLGAQARSEAPLTKVPPAEIIDGVVVVNGGVGSDEARAIKKAAPDFPVQVEISGRGGNYYVADSLQILQRGRLVTEVPDAGPLLLMDLQPGRYQMVGYFDGTVVSRELNVTRDGATVHWVVPSNID